MPTSIKKQKIKWLILNQDNNIKDYGEIYTEKKVIYYI